MRAVGLRALLGGLIVIGGCSGKDDPIGPEIGSRFILSARPAQKDTVEAAPIQALVVELRDDQGHVASGRVVRFESAASPDTLRRTEHGVFVCGLRAAQCTSSVFTVDTTDQFGRAKALLSFGTLAGPTWVVLTAPEFGLRDSVAFTVEPGAVARFSMRTRDTTLTVGNSYSAGITAADRFGNRRGDGPTLTADGSTVTVDATGTITTRAVGRGYVVARFGNAADTAWASVVPSGSFVASRFFGTPPNAIVEVAFDGTGMRALAANLASPADGFAPGPIADGLVVFHAGDYPTGRVYISQPGNGNARRRLTPDDLTFDAERYPRASSDGSWVYFSARRPGDYSYSLWRVRPDATGLEAVLLPLPTGSIDWRPAPSPDGKTLAFTSTRSGFSEIRTLDIASRVVRPLGARGISPRWSPDGGRIAFVDVDGGALHVMQADGSSSRVVSKAGRYYGEQIDWTSDGQWLIAALDGRLELVRVSDGTVVPLAFSSGMSQPTTRR